jgi:hypothetical protein
VEVEVEQDQLIVDQDQGELVDQVVVEWEDQDQMEIKLVEQEILLQ